MDRRTVKHSILTILLLTSQHGICATGDKFDGTVWKWEYRTDDGPTPYYMATEHNGFLGEAINQSTIFLEAPVKGTKPDRSKFRALKSSDFKISATTLIDNTGRKYVTLGDKAETGVPELGTPDVSFYSNAMGICNRTVKTLPPGKTNIRSFAGETPWRVKINANGASPIIETSETKSIYITPIDDSSTNGFMIDGNYKVDAYFNWTADGKGNLSNDEDVFFTVEVIACTRDPNRNIISMALPAGTKNISGTYDIQGPYTPFIPVATIIIPNTSNTPAASSWLETPYQTKSMAVGDKLIAFSTVRTTINPRLSTSVSCSGSINECRAGIVPGEYNGDLGGRIWDTTGTTATGSGVDTIIVGMTGDSTGSGTATVTVTATWP